MKYSAFGSAALLLMLLLLQGCTGLPAAYPRAESRSLPRDLGNSILTRRFAPPSAEHPALSGFHVLTAGMDGLAARVQIIRCAESSLDLQYFIFRGDKSGSLITNELRRAADRGVRIRVIVDDGDTTAGDERILELDGYRDMQVRVFNPFDYRGHNRILRNLDFVLHKSRLDYRMHNKLMIADGAVALIGGRNVGDQYFQIDPASQFADDDVFVVGAALPTLMKSFEEFWNSDVVREGTLLKTSAHTHLHRAPYAALSPDFDARIASGEPLNALMADADQLTWAPGTVLYDSPDKALIRKHARPGKLMSAAVEREIEVATQELIIVSPYFVPSEHELALLENAALRKSRVRILTNSMESTPEVAAHSGYQKVRIPLIKSGAELFEVRAKLDSTRGSGQGPSISKYGNYALHGKMYVLDRAKVFLGSWNYDQRSLRINTEIGLLIESAVVAGGVAQRFDSMVSPEAAYRVQLETDSHQRDVVVWTTRIQDRMVRLTVEPSRGLFRRVKARLLSLLPLEPEL